MPPPRKRLGELLVEQGTLDTATVQGALSHQAKRGGRVGQVLVEQQKITEDQLLQALAAQLGVQPIRLREHRPHPAALALVPRDLAVRFNLVPLALARDSGKDMLAAASTDPTNPQMMALVEQRLGVSVRAYLASEVEVARALNEHYADQGFAAMTPPPRNIPAPTFRSPGARISSFGALVAPGAAAPPETEQPTLNLGSNPAAAPVTPAPLPAPAASFRPAEMAPPPVDGVTMDLSDELASIQLESVPLEPVAQDEPTLHGSAPAPSPPPPLEPCRWTNHFWLKPLNRRRPRFHPHLAPPSRRKCACR